MFDKTNIKRMTTW